MLKTSPILSDSGNASPTSFRYAPATTSPSSFRQPAAIRRRQSTRSATSPTDSMKSLSSQQPTEAREPSEVQNMVNHSFSGGSTTTATTDSGPSQQSTTPLSTGKSQLQNAISPNKRRGSPGPGISQITTPNAKTRTENTTQETSTRDDNAPQSTKRARPDAPPPKILPQRYELCPVEHMVELIAHMLAELITTNDAIRISNGGLTRFHSRTAPGISVRDYLHRLARHATLTPPLLLAMVYYIDRLCALYQEFTINTLTVHRFLITAATVASKGLSDSFWNNTTYARVGGVRPVELKLLELEFLYRVDWKIVPNPEVLVAYYKGLVERTPGYELELDGSEDGDGEEEEEEEDGDESDE